MNPENDVLRIERVKNGWVVFPHSFTRAREGYTPDCAWIAETPTALASLLKQWAIDQEKLPA